MNWLSEIEKLVDRKPEWHSRLMNAINCGLAQHTILLDDLCLELDAPFGLAVSNAVDHYQRRAEDEWHDEYRTNPSSP